MSKAFTPSAIAIVILFAGCGAFTGPDDVIVSNPQEAVREARTMIDEQRADPSKYSGWLYEKDLLPSLRVPGLHHASVHTDHLDLVLARNPDWEIGARIGAKDHRPHKDKPTRYPDIYFYDYSNDEPESPENIR